MLTRRDFLSTAAATAALPACPAWAAGPGGMLRFKAAFPAPAPLSPTARPIAVEGLDASGGIRLGESRATGLRLGNDLSETIVPAWRGLRGAGDLDHPALALKPGIEAALPVPGTEGGTLLLRAAPAPTQPAARGAEAVIVVGSPNDPPVDHDLVLLLNDWLLAAYKTLVFGSVPPAAATASVVTVNGSAQSCTGSLAPRSRVRVRIVNGSVQRLAVLSFSGARPKIAAIDSQPSELFAPVNNAIPVGPGARYDILFDMPDAAGTDVRVSLKPTLTIAGQREPGRDLMILRCEGSAVPPRGPIMPLPLNPSLPVSIPLETAKRVELTIDGHPGTPVEAASRWSFTEPKGLAPGQPVLTVRRGDTVTLGFSNATDALVPLRIGGHAIRLLHAKDDGWEPYWRDTLLLAPKGRAHVAFVADAPGRWPIDSGFDDLTLAGLSCFFTVRP